MPTHFLVYKTTNTINNKAYIGVHKTDDLHDGYLGSGKCLARAIAKHGTKAFRREILFECESALEMYARERELVTEAVTSDAMYYNIRVGGDGGWDYVNKASLSHEMLARRISAKRQRWLTDESYRTECRKTLAKVRISWLGRKHSDETRKKQSDWAKANRKSPTAGKNWMTDGIVSRPIAKAEQSEKLSTGWRFGRVCKWTTSQSRMVDKVGIEPTTSALQKQRSPS